MNIKIIIITILIIIIILLTRIYFEVNRVKIENMILKSKKLLKGQRIRIIHISDLHNKKLSNNSLFQEMEDFKPDIIALTGDIIDKRTSDFHNVYEWLEGLVKISNNTYFVSGNHEWKNTKAAEFIDGIAKRRIKIINNSKECINKDGFIINICGIDDPYTNHENTYKAFSSIDTSNFTLLLSHSPNILFKSKALPCDLILCGHTHGGQIRLPFLGGLIASGQGFFPKYDKGLYKLENNRLLYINSGLGTSMLPIRFLNRSQISFITLISE